MPRFVFFLLTLGLLATLSSNSTGSGDAPDRGWGMDPDGSTTSSEETDRGWEMDPDG